MQIQYGKISIIMMKAEFTGGLELLFSAVLVGQREAQTAQCHRSAHCSPDDYLMRSCFAFPTSCSALQEQIGGDETEQRTLFTARREQLFTPS